MRRDYEPGDDPRRVHWRSSARLGELVVDIMPTDDAVLGFANPFYRAALEAAGMRFSGMSPDGLLPEVVEYPDHPWFVGVQYHPELKSKPFAPHPLFASFVQAAVAQSRLV